MLLVLLAGLLVVCQYYLQPPLFNKNFGLLDGRNYFGPNAFFLDVSLRNGEFPLWNPLSYCGMPFAADPQANACYPFHLLRSVLTPAYNPYATAAGLHLLVVLHLLMAGLGVVCLAREYGLSRWAGLAGAFVFMLGPFSIIYGTEFYVYPLVTSWAPWILWAAHRAFTARRFSDRVFYTAWTALLYGMSTLGAFPQLTLYIGVLLGGYAVLHGLLHLEWQGFRRSCGRFFQTVLGHALFLVMVAAFGALMAAVVLVPAFELGMQSARVASSGVKVTAGGPNADWMHLLKCLVIFTGDLWAPIGCRAAGIGSLLACLAALAHPRKRDVLVFLGLFLLLTDCTIGPPFPVGTLLHKMDFLNITVSPWRAGIISALPLALAVAFGVDAAGRAAASYSKSAFRTIWLVNAGLAMMYVLMHYLAGKPLYQPWFWVWALPLGTLATMCFFAWVRLPRLGTAVIGCLIMGEILAWGAQMLPLYVSSRIGGGPTARFGTVKELSRENTRTAVSTPNWQMWTLDMTMNGYNPLYVGETRRLLCKPGNEHVYRGHLKQDEVLVDNQMGHLLLKRTFWLTRQWTSGPLPAKDQVFPSATTVFLPGTAPDTVLPVPEIKRDQVPAKAVSEETERVNLGFGKELETKIRTLGMENALTLPVFQQDHRHSALYVGYTASRAVEFEPSCADEHGGMFKLKQTRAVTTPKERFLEIPLPDCGRNTITLRWPAQAKNGLHLTQAYVLKDLSDENDLLSIVERRANSIEVIVKDLPEARILTYLDSYYAGWRAWVDHQEVPIMKADDAFKAITVPQGTHFVRFEFRPWSAYAGAALSLFATGFLLLMIGGSRRYPYRAQKSGRRTE